MTGGSGNMNLDIERVHDVEVLGSEGNVTASLGGCATGGAVELQVAVGSVVLTVPKNVAGRFDVSSVVGCVDVAKELGLAVEGRIPAGRSRGKSVRGAVPSK